MKKKISITIEDSLLKEVEDKVDGLVIRNRSQAIEELLKKGLGKNKTAVILCGGSFEENVVDGNLRFSADLDGSSLIEKNIQKLKREGFRDVYIVGEDKVITEIFSLIKNGEEYGLDVEYIEEKTSEGTFNSLKNIQEKIDSTFLVMYGDVFTEADMEELWQNHLENSGSCTLLLTTSEEPERSGVVSLEGNKVKDFKQKPEEAEEYIIFSSVFVCNPEVLEFEGESVERDLFPKLIENNSIQGHLTSRKRIHLHDETDLEEAKEFFE